MGAEKVVKARRRSVVGDQALQEQKGITSSRGRRSLFGEGEVAAGAPLRACVTGRRAKPSALSEWRVRGSAHDAR